MGASLKITFNKQRIATDGYVTIYASIIINRITKCFSLDVRWPKDMFDFENGLCRKRHEKDEEAEDFNIILRMEIAKINKIFRNYRLQDKELTMKAFIAEYRSDLNRNDFLTYMKKKAWQRHRSGEITESTYDSTMRTYRKLLGFDNPIPFKDINDGWVDRFEAWMTSNKMGKNSKWFHHKNIKTYIRLAIKKDNISIANPYINFKISKVPGSWRPIYQEQIDKLYEYYTSDKIPINEKRVLRAFLFCCTTGLRISDLYRVTDEWNLNGTLKFIPHKTRRLGKILEIPLHKASQLLFNQALEDKGVGLLFNDYKEAYANKLLRRIAEKLHIKERLHFHVGRHTFITMYISKTNDLVGAKEFAGHSDIQQTMVYAHFDRKKSKERIAPMGNIFDSD